jgi:hypothetical protein
MIRWGCWKIKERKNRMGTVLPFNSAVVANSAFEFATGTGVPDLDGSPAELTGDVSRSEDVGEMVVLEDRRQQAEDLRDAVEIGAQVERDLEVGSTRIAEMTDPGAVMGELGRILILDRQVDKKLPVFGCVEPAMDHLFRTAIASCPVLPIASCQLFMREARGRIAQAQWNRNCPWYFNLCVITRQLFPELNGNGPIRDFVQDLTFGMTGCTAEMDWNTVAAAFRDAAQTVRVKLAHLLTISQATASPEKVSPALAESLLLGGDLLYAANNYLLFIQAS